eukprot:8273087-Pyramimonas_sp.AAC.1
MSMGACLSFGRQAPGRSSVGSTSLSLPGRSLAAEPWREQRCFGGHQHSRCMDAVPQHIHDSDRSPLMAGIDRLGGGM